MKKNIKSIFKYLLVTVVSLLGLSSNWYMSRFAGVTIEEMIFTIKAPIAGVDSEMITSFLKMVIVPTVFILLTFIFATKLFPKIKVMRKSKAFKLRIDVVLLAFLLAISFINVKKVYADIDLKEYVENQNNKNTIYEEHYIDPEEASLSFPDEKPNIIHLILESIETTFASKEYGGAYDHNLIPNITELAEDNISFSTSDKLTGGYISRSTNFTVGSLVAQTAGVPLTVSIHGNSYSGYGQFLPGAYSIGEILEEEGYNQTFLLGSDAEFGGREDYFTYHGNYDIHDYNYAKDTGMIPEDYKVWWGYEDQKLYSFAKEELLEISKKDEPFNYTMLTADTHHVSGYKCELCRDEYPEQYSNVISCADRQVDDFINWVKKQDFYDNTVIFITGDHNSMDPEYFTDMDKDYRRAPYNLIINPQVDDSNVDLKSRSFYTMDWYPTVLGAMGVDIEGNRLGLGTNMFSERETLMEKLGTDYLLDELRKKSQFFEEKLLFDND